MDIVKLTREEKISRRESRKMGKRFNPENGLKPQQLQNIQNKVDRLIEFIEATNVDEENKMLAIEKIKSSFGRAINFLTE